MQTLSFGFKKPQTGDRGSVYFPALEDDIQQLNDHSHNGVDSALLSSSSFQAITQNLAAADWVLVSNGKYRQLVTVPGAITTLADWRVEFLDSSGNQQYLTMDRVSTTTYYVSINDNSIALVAQYL
jgi:hypothetical protein